MTLLFTGVRRALRQPRALALSWGSRLLMAWVIASPLSRALTAQSTANLPRGDAVLFDPGGIYLLEALRLAWPVLVSELRGALLVGSVLAWLSLVPLGVLIVALLSERSERVARSLPRALGLLPRFTLLSGLTLLVQGVLIAGFGWAAFAMRERLPPSFGERSVDLTSLLLVGIGLVLSASAGVIQDLARVASSDEDCGVPSAVLRALGAIRKSPGHALGSWLATGGFGLGLVVAAAALTQVIDVARPGSWRVVLVALLHQTTVLCLVALRATWLGTAIEIVRRATPTRADAPASSDALADPSPHPAA